MPADDWLRRVRSALRAKEPVRSLERRPTSAVAVVLTDSAEGPLVLLTLRADTLGQHPGEISFPGGRIEPSDASSQAAALRELWEETGIKVEEVRPLGHLVDYETFRHQWVAAHVVHVEASTLSRPRTPPSDEVADVFVVPIAGFLKPGGVVKLVRVGLAPFVNVEAYEGRSYEASAEAERVVHYWRLTNGRTLWGITAHLLSVLLGRAYGWRPPSAPRRIRSRDEIWP